MSEPLTEKELDTMASTGPTACLSCPRAAAEIRELRERVDQYDLDATKLNNTFVTIRRKLEADNSRLRKYIQHKGTCLVYNRAGPHYCTCGLDDVLKELDDGKV